MLQLGTARITASVGYRKPTDALVFTVLYMNHGNFTKPEPRAFWTDTEAREWCAERGLRVVS